MAAVQLRLRGLLVLGLVTCVTAAHAPLLRRDVQAGKATVDRALAAFNAGELVAAARLAADAVALDALSADAHHLLCASLLPNREQLPRALTACQEAVKLRPADGAMRNSLGETYRKLG